MNQMNNPTAHDTLPAIIARLKQSRESYQDYGETYGNHFDLGVAKGILIALDELAKLPKPLNVRPATISIPHDNC